MKQQKKVEWTRLDNASKIFPATYTNTDTKVFRFACELFESVEPKLLQEALDITIESFPFFKSILRRGVFWYYFESTDSKPMVEIESKPVCAAIYNPSIKNLLFRVFYYQNRINVEVFHALSDGKGSLLFLQTLVYHYLMLKNAEAFKNNKPTLDYNASISEKMDDSFKRYFPGESIYKLSKWNKKIGVAPSAYHVRGKTLRENRISLIEGAVSVQAIKEQAKKYNTTFTIFIASLFIYSIYTTMPARVKKRPIVLSIPINLRQFFNSETVRNFFSTMNIGYQFKQDTIHLEDIIEKISRDFSDNFKEEQLIHHLNRLMALENNPFTRIIPIPLKDISLRLANVLNNRKLTATMSNVGQVSMPLEFNDYIRQFSVCTSPRRPQMAMCSYGDRLVISFTSPFQETEIQRIFFEFLSKRGVDIEISSNL